MIKIEVTTYDTGAKCIAILDHVYKDLGIILTECVGDGEFYHVTQGTVAEGETVEDPCCEQLVELHNDLYFRDYSEKSSDRPYTDYPLKGVLEMNGLTDDGKWILLAQGDPTCDNDYNVYASEE